MPDTPVSLLERLGLRPDAESWRRLVDLYTPLITSWLRVHGSLQLPDVEDLTQEVLAVLVRELPQFRHDLRPGAFRRWLRTVTVNRLRTFWRSRGTSPAAAGGEFERMLDQWEDPDSPLGRLWDREHDEHVVRRLLELIRPEFEPTTWRAFELLVLEGRPTRAVAAELGLSANAVRIAKSRVFGRFRREAEGLIDD